MPSIAITLGDPTSIGPEVAAASLSVFLKKSDINIEVFAPSWALSPKNYPALKKFFLSGRLRFSTEVSDLKKVSRPGRASGKIALDCLQAATDACISKKHSALVTGPVDKHLCSLTDPKFTGHTGYLEKRTRSKGTTMLMSGPDLQIALVTTHIPLASVSKSLTQAKIVATGKRVFEHLKRLQRSPKIAVCGLNPHASDNGLIGHEEGRIIAPAVKELQRAYGDAFQGPFSADSLFHQAGWSAIICMYHDQGLIPLKMKNFYDAVNVSLGLAFLRTSVDHGTAFDLVGTGRASSMSYLRALEYAYDWIQLKYSNPGRSRAQSQRSLA